MCMVYINKRVYLWKLLHTWIHEVEIPWIIGKSELRIAPQADNLNFKN